MNIWNPGYSKFTYFWGKNDGPFSQWVTSYFVIDNIEYCTAEQYMMAQKAILFQDEDQLLAIMKETDPRKQKELGKQVSNFVKSEWDSVARNVVYKGNYAKYTQNPKMLESLMKTSETLLVEASPYDRIWGIGIDATAARAGKPWKGTNWLGEVLTKLRENLEMK
ncbi:MAG: DUF1768 domain-containing protein [Crenarchaeota archaeon]|nr:MAG: DUF1768 domain-containing protein [Thermoproteota archaeon]